MLIFHIAEGPCWREAQDTGRYEAVSLATEGFIHLSTAEQLPGTLRRFYAGAVDLVLLGVRTEVLSAELRWEDADVDGHAVAFPHLYGPLPLEEVAHVRDAGSSREIEEELPALVRRWSVGP